MTIQNEVKLDRKLVSIIMPTYNVEKYILETIESVKNQIHNNWELIIVDDCSTDCTLNVIRKEAMKDVRIKFSKLDSNKGAAYARNIAVEKAMGKYLAFLDSDDLWHPEKLKEQIDFMEKFNINFSCTSYEKIDEKSNKINETIKVNSKMNYWGLLKNCPGNSTIIYNMDSIGKIYTPEIRKRNDYALWLKVIKKTDHIYGLDKVLASHRIRENSISFNKKSLIKYHWLVYRKLEKLSLGKSLYLLCFWIFKGINRKIKKGLFTR